MSFLPAAPKNIAQQASPVEAPVAAPNPYLPAQPTFVRSSVEPAAPKQTEVERRLMEAEQRFQEGKRLYLAGQSVTARVAFDAAIDILLGTPDSDDRHRVETKLEQLVQSIYKYDVNGLGAGDLGRPKYDKAPLDEILEMTFPVDPGLTHQVEEQISATTSQLPLELNDVVLSYINYFSGPKGRRTVEAGLKRAGRYREMISRILAEEGVPQEFIYLAQAESGFLPRAVSYKAAVGMWQFIQSRGREYGLKQSAYFDDRLDPERATRSAARHLKDLHSKFGDWYLAVAAYNCGDGCVERAVERTGYADFWRLRSLGAIPKETTNYVPIILALTIMHKNAKSYGLEEVEPDAALRYETVEFESPTHLALIADAADRPVSEIRDLNPALLTSIAPGGYPVHLPAGTRTMVLAALETIPREKRASWRVHRVDEDDTIESIARQYNIPVSAIEQVNAGTSADAGEVLAIPTHSQVERISTSHSKTSVKRSTPRRGSSKTRATRAARKPAAKQFASKSKTSTSRRSQSARLR